MRRERQPSAPARRIERRPRLGDRGRSPWSRSPAAPARRAWRPRPQATSSARPARGSSATMHHQPRGRRQAVGCRVAHRAMPRALAAQRVPGHPARRPRPLEVEAAEPPVHVQDLADQIQARADARLHRARCRSRPAARHPPSPRRRRSRGCRRPRAAWRAIACAAGAVVACQVRHRGVAADARPAPTQALGHRLRQALSRARSTRCARGRAACLRRAATRRATRRSRRAAG